ncbi:MAG TPA: hypothetical protein DD435_15195 [Cyanobacteria bacterium UBA8530]|nr:hypothetical protein [Cyanobacteria bacterium UBA8530]
MNFERLHSFLIAAEELSFTQAARRLHLSQPAISQQVREIEDDLGVSLFERRGRSVILTPAGEKLRPLAVSILQQLRELRRNMEEFRGVPQGVLKIGAGDSVGIYLLPRVLGYFTQRHPDIRTSLQIGEFLGLLRGLKDGNIDLALIEEEPSAEQLQGLKKIRFIEDELVLIVSPAHEWAKRGTIKIEELGQAWFIARKSDSSIRGLIRNRLSEAGLDPNRLNVRFEFGNAEGIKRSVMAELGVGFVSKFSLMKEIAANYLVNIEVEGLKIKRTIWLVHSSRMGEGSHERAFCEELLAQKWLPPHHPDVRPEGD